MHHTQWPTLLVVEIALATLCCSATPPAAERTLAPDSRSQTHDAAVEVAPSPSADAHGIPESPDPPTEPAPLALTGDEAWAWLRREAPDQTEQLQTVPAPTLVDSLLAWAPPGETITVFDRGCRKLELTRNERTLDGDIHVKSTVRNGIKTVSGSSISFGYDVTETCGFENRYERSSSGAWVQTATSATGCAYFHGDTLSRVTESEVWYGGEPVTVSAVCTMQHSQPELCQDGSIRTCTECLRIGLEISSATHRSAHPPIVKMGASTPSDPIDCSIPCPIDDREEILAVVNAAMASATLTQVGLEAHPTLFRTRAACRAYRRKHTISADDLQTW